MVDIESGLTRRLAVFRPSDTFLNQFLPFFDQYALSHRIWSPDSQALVLPMINGEGLAEITVIPVDGGPLQPITRGVIGFWSYQ